MMIRASILDQAHFSQSPETLVHITELRSQEQKCFSAIQKCKSMDGFKQIQAQALKFGLNRDEDLISACALSAWGSMDYACSIFHQIDDPSTFIWNTMIRGFVKNSEPEKALLFYEQMQEQNVEPDSFTFPFVLKGCAHLSAFDEGIQVHGLVFKFGLGSDVFVQNSLINMYGKCGEIKLCSKVFDKMPQRSIASWSALISARNCWGLWNECLCLFREMNAEGWRADESTLVSVLSSCTQLGALDLGRCTHGSLVRSYCELNVIAMTSLINMYIRCGCLQKGMCLFGKMPQKNILSYSVMISGLALHGCGKEALTVFSDMLGVGIKPDDLVYVGVLSACSHAGLVDEGLHCFDRMRIEHQIVPTIQHYTCMVDLLGRAGRLHEAYDLIKSMPVEPNEIVWRCLLNACRVHQDLELGELASRNLFRLETQNVGDYVLLSNMYARALRWDGVAKVRTDMMRRGLEQTPGFSLVEVKGIVHKFVSQDKSHPQSKAVYEMLHQIGWQLRFEGYSPDTSQVLFDVDEEEKRRLLPGHSQQLAIAFALISTSQGSAIRIVKNLRMCDDCHTCARLISKIFEREIIVRDRNRFHHFKDGACSCGNFW